MGWFWACVLVAVNISRHRIGKRSAGTWVIEMRTSTQTDPRNRRFGMGFMLVCVCWCLMSSWCFTGCLDLGCVPHMTDTTKAQWVPENWTGGGSGEHDLRVGFIHSTTQPYVIDQGAKGVRVRAVVETGPPAPAHGLPREEHLGN